MRRLLGPLVALALGFGCKGPMSKIEALRDALAGGDETVIRDRLAGYPTCKDQEPKLLVGLHASAYDPACLSSIANALGSQQGFVVSPPDHAAAATTALVLARDGRGDAVAHLDTWLTDIKSAKGTGHDALRLAVARKMAAAAPVIGKKLDDETSARAAIKAVVGAVPGACPTYWLVGTSASNVPPELSPDHSACVQHDLARREGPGGTYGAGLTRALEGALAIWRETERALRLGAPSAHPNAKATIEAKLALIEAATQKIETVRVDSSSSSTTISALGEAHLEAGVPIIRPRRGDGGAPPASPPPLRRPDP